MAIRIYVAAWQWALKKVLECKKKTKKQKNQSYSPRWMQHQSPFSSETENWAIKNHWSPRPQWAEIICQRLSALPLQRSLEHQTVEGVGASGLISQRLSQLPVQAPGWIPTVLYRSAEQSAPLWPTGVGSKDLWPYFSFNANLPHIYI